jgi:heat shock protein HspQ
MASGPHELEDCRLKRALVPLRSFVISKVTTWIPGACPGMPRSLAAQLFTGSVRDVDPYFAWTSRITATGVFTISSFRPKSDAPSYHALVSDKDSRWAPTVPIVNIELNENMEFACPPSSIPVLRSAHSTCWPPRRQPSNLEPHSIWRISHLGTSSSSYVAR